MPKLLRKVRHSKVKGRAIDQLPQQKVHRASAVQQSQVQLTETAREI